ncbi:protein DpdJ [Micromonospora chersina]|uniref:protein DpdJ n=1 Tax=Micromonospora chersina TaxID=47854 RepID=UPI0037115AAF
MHTLESILDLLEQREDALLSWGVVDGGFEEDELIALVDAWLLEHDPTSDAWALVDSMRDNGLLHRDLSTEPPRWRTRSAEALRLLARLRQLFPTQGNQEDSWRRGAPLVADLRYVRRPRAYPRRDQTLASLMAAVPGLTAAQREVLTLLTGDSSGQRNLSGFQVRATRQVLASATSGRSGGIVVGAGTGSGKTLAFYLPAFAHLASLQDSKHWTRVVAVYPRNELLRDQLSSAFASARRLDEVFSRTSGRPLRIAAFYGPTPHSARSVDGQYSSWDKVGGGHRCPYLSCPGVAGVGCGGDLVWQHQDRSRGRERLVCAGCGTSFDEDVVVLTRRRMVQQPPDMLFTTTEMLNRSLSDLQASAVFGVGTRRAPMMMLLDEIHTYNGTSGAQAGMVLRRWRHRLRSQITFVGLSATLVDAAKYFSDLTGLSADIVASVEPEPEELEYEGAEHLLALRSDPTTGVSVLSTTIQTSMLLPRTLDPPGTAKSAGLYGSKLFVFTDDLDVTNRLYYDLLDAEGQRLDGKGRAVGFKDALASLRDPTHGGGSARRAAGQSWDLPEALGHPMRPGSRLRLGRTSSQDAGVDSASQITVATASLEVGFDDPDVGAVLQHKAPRDIAQFLQRKGRAGRPRGMRPWTVVVLSDYGRDRDAYEAWDLLFDPVLPARSLPVRNRAVLRMHAVQAMLDWLAERLRPQVPDASLWRDLTKPRDKSSWGQARGAVQDRVAALLENLLEDVTLQSELARWIGQALQVPPTETNELLWHPPRPVLLAAVPALLRRLRSGWATAQVDGRSLGKDLLGGTPLPDFFPSNLFSDLALPEALVKVPAQLEWEEEGDWHAMGIAQALREFAPGRVSRRFATRSMRHRHWLPLPADVNGRIYVERVFPEHEIEVEADVVVDGRRQTLELVRPHNIVVDIAPKEVRDSSNAYLIWESQFVERGAPAPMRLPQEDPIGRLLSGVSFHLHAEHAHIEARRLAVGADATLRMEDGTEVRARPTFARGEGVPVGVGAVYDVDALRLDVVLPSDYSLPNDVSRGVRSAWLRHVVTTDSQLLEHANVFQLGWVHEALEITLIRAAVEHGMTLDQAFVYLDRDLQGQLNVTMEILFQRVGLVIEDDDMSAGPGRLRARLQSLLQRDGFAKRLAALAPEMWRPTEELQRPWLRTRLLATVGQAALAAGRLLCPDHDPEGLLIDVQPGLDAEGRLRNGQVWLSESSVGGGGFLEALASRLQRDPRRFLRLMRHALRPSAMEVIDNQMRRIIHLLAKEGPLVDAMAAYRGAHSQAARVEALSRVRHALRDAGMAPDHGVVSALASRLLRPGSTSATDRAMGQVVGAWDAEERRLGVEIDARTWAFLSSGREELDHGLPLTGGGDLRQRRLDALRSLLWPRGWRMRSAALQSWNPYTVLPDPAPEALRAILIDGTVTVDINDADAAERLRHVLSADGAARLRGGPGQEAEVSDMLVGLMTEPIETEFLHIYPYVAEVAQTADGATLVRLELAEVVS